MRRRHRSPLVIRRIGYVLMFATAIAAGVAGFRESAVWMIGALSLAVTAAAFYMRASDILLDFDYRRVRRQATGFMLAGMATALLGCIIASALVDGQRASFVRTIGYAAIGGGIAAGLSGLVTTLWSFAGTYAGEQIEKRSQEDW